MVKFKKGDKVKATQACMKWHQCKLGEEGVILESIYDGTKDGGYPYQVRWANGHINAYNNEDIESFKPKQFINK